MTRTFTIDGRQVTLTEEMWAHWLNRSHLIERCSTCRTVKACVLAAQREAGNG